MALDSVLLRALRGVRISPRQAPMLQQAVGEAVARYAPEYDQLAQLREQSAGTLRQARGQATSAAQLKAALANQALHTVAQTRDPVISQLISAPAPANSSAAVLAQNLGLTEQASRSMLGQAAANAPIAAQQEIAKAQMTHQGDLDKINSQRSSLYGQAGNFITGRLGDLVGEDRKLRHDTNEQLRSLRSQESRARTQAETTRRGQTLSHEDRVRGQNLSHTDRQASIDARNKGKLPGGVKRATPQQHGSLKDTLGTALDVVKQQRKLGKDRHKIAQTLLQGRRAQTLELQPGDQGYNPSDKSKNKVPLPALPKVPQLVLSAALDLVYDGHVSQRNVRELHKRGYSVNELGLNTKPPKRRPSRRVAGPAAPAGPAGRLS